MDHYFLHETAAYDLVFCRNFLIYLNPEAQQKVIKNIERVLAHQGLLFVGHTESNVIIDTGLFTAMRQPLTFVHRKKPASEIYLQTPLKLNPSHRANV